MKKILIAFSFLVLLLSAYAHEYILLAYKYRVERGDTLEMHLFVADGFNIELERPVQTSITKRFRLLTANGEADLLAETPDGTLPVINRKVDFDGLGLVYTERDYAINVLPTNTFLDYLKEDHIENIRLKEHAAKKQQTERYTRYIKALVQSGKAGKDTLYKTITGQQYEIVLLQNPYLLRKGSTLQARLLFMGKPLTGKVVTARNRTGNSPALALTSRTDKNGICSFKLTRQGDWFLHSTHMIPSPDKTEADWESFWTSYSFGVE